MRNLLLSIGAIALFTAAACSTSSNTSTGSNTVKSSGSPIAETAKNIPHPSVARISLADAKAAFDSGDAVFIDTHSETSFARERISGSINIPAAKLAEKIDTIPKGKKIIAYCSWPAENSSAGLVLQLNEKGFTNTYALLGGTAAWKGAGYPMETGSANANN